VPKTSPRSDASATERGKVLLSVGQTELARIDERATAAGMSRSAYMVEMTLRDEAALLSAIATLQDELKRFAADNAGWRGEVAQLRNQIHRQDETLNNLRSLLQNFLDEIGRYRKSDDSISLATVTDRLKMLSEMLSR
jgi:hypothetical protein